MRVLITIVIILFAYSASAADLSKVYEDSHLKGYIYQGETEIFKGVHIVSTHVVVKSRMKKIREEVDQDYVINCNTNTFHTENTVTYNHGKVEQVFDWTEEETDIDAGFPLKLREIVCESDLQVKEEACVKVNPKDEGQRKFMRAFYAGYNKTICE